MKSSMISLTFHSMHESFPVKFLFGFDNSHHLAGRKNLKKFLMIPLLDFLYLDVNIVLHPNGPHARDVIIGVDMAELSHLVEQRPLLALHLPEEGEKARCVTYTESCFLGDILFHLRFKFLWIEGRTVLSIYLCALQGEACQ